MGWSMGMFIGLGVASIFVIPALVIFITSLIARIRYRNRDKNSRYWNNRHEYEESLGYIIGSGLVLVVLGGIIAMSMAPFSKEYHYYTKTEGVVVAIEERFTGDGDATNEEYVIQFDGSDTKYTCDSDQCALVDIGDMLVLGCIKVWDYNATDKYSCKWVRHYDL